MIDRIQSLQDLQENLGPQAEEIKERALEAAAAARERMNEGLRTLRDFVTEQPVQALGLALGMGVLLGWLIKRR